MKSAEAVEVEGGGERVDAGTQAPFRVLAKICEHVHERVSHSARRRELTPMPAISPQRTPTAEQSIHVEGDSDRDASNSGGQSSLVSRFDDEVDVIPLNGKVDDPESSLIALRGAPKREANGRKNVLAPERPKRGTERHMHGMASDVLEASTVGNQGPRSDSLSPRVGPLAAPAIRE